MARFCSNCGNELDSGSVMCVKCGTMVNSNKTSNKGKFPIWAIVLIAFFAIMPFIIFIVLGIFAFSYIKYSDIDVEEYIDNIVVSRGSYGDRLSDGEVNITLDDAVVYLDINGNTANDGKEYLVFFFDIDNISDDSISIFRHNFSGYVDGKMVNSIDLGIDIEGYKPLDVILDDGEDISGYVVYEVDTDWEDFSIHFNRDTMGFDSIIFDISNISVEYK